MMEPNDTSPPPTLTFHGTPEAQQKLMEALAVASAAWVNIPRDGLSYYTDRNGDPRRYTTIAAMMKHCRPSMSKNGITLLSPVSNGADGEHRVTVILMGHGARIEACVDISRASLGKGPQEWGKVLTYLRRYSIQGMLGIEGDNDPDEDAPSDQVKPDGSPAKKKRGKRSAPPKPEGAKDTQRVTEEDNPFPPDEPPGPPEEEAEVIEPEVVLDPTDDQKSKLKELAKVAGFTGQAGAMRLNENCKKKWGVGLTGLDRSTIEEVIDWVKALIRKDGKTVPGEE